MLINNKYYNLLYLFSIVSVIFFTLTSAYVVLFVCLSGLFTVFQFCVMVDNKNNLS